MKSKARLSNLLFLIFSNYNSIIRGISFSLLIIIIFVCVVQLYWVRQLSISISLRRLYNMKPKCYVRYRIKFKSNKYTINYYNSLKSIGTFNTI